MTFQTETHVAAPTGKQTIRGTIISAKAGSNDFGKTYRMTVKVTTPAGCYLVNGAIPGAIWDECEAKLECLAGGWIVVLVGCEIQFTATLETSDSAHFAFAKRPTKATIVGVPTGKERQPKGWDPKPAEDHFAQFETA